MSKVNPCLRLAIARLTNAGPDNFLIWVLEAPDLRGEVHCDCIWPINLTRKWLAWQEMFSLQPQGHLPLIHHRSHPLKPLPPQELSSSAPNIGYGGRLMQDLGVSLWQWLFNEPIGNSFAQSRGIALGQDRSLRLRLDIRDPNLTPIPWEIMQSEGGMQAISLNRKILLSRTTNKVDPLQLQPPQNTLKILLVLGHPGTQKRKGNSEELKLQQEADILTRVIKQQEGVNKQLDSTLPALLSSAPIQVDPLLQPNRRKLIETLDRGKYNILFYGGHGAPAPDGGLLWLGAESDDRINGTELAQVLVRNQVTLAVFNACWGAQPYQTGQTTMARSSLAEVLVHHGVPAVLGMRDSIADPEALSFIEAFTKALSVRMAIDEAVVIARQQLLTLYKFNQPTWTLPILYMHPQFNGELIPAVEPRTELPTVAATHTHPTQPQAFMRSLTSGNQTPQGWSIRGGLMSIGRSKNNDLVIQEQWVSQHHGKIVCRESRSTEARELGYFLEDFSRYGTYVFIQKQWQKVHHRTELLQSGMQIRFGSTQGQVFEFRIEN